MLISDYFCSSTQERLSIEEVVLSDLNTMNPTLLMQQRGIFVKPKGEEAIFEFITTVIEYHNSVFSNVSKFELQSSFYKSAEGFESSLSRYKDFYY
jgi:hypothetical protein